MDQTKALHELLEAADLVRMLEELSNPGVCEKLSTSSMSGMRITLRNIREQILHSHDVMAGHLVNKAKAAVDAKSNGSHDLKASDIVSETDLASALKAQSNNGSTQRSTNIVTDSQRIQLTRRDLRASLEKMVEKQ
jgi:hypothetical protein